MSERQQNYTIAENFYLPSGGLIYDKKVDPVIELRSMTARDEMKRLSPSAAQFKTLANLIEGCMLEKPAVSVYDMALGDYEYLLHKLRIVTYGDEYKMVLNCPSCGEQIEPIAHLEQLEVRGVDIEEFEKLRSFTLPRSGKLITIKIKTPRILDEITLKTKEMTRKFKDAEIDFSELVSLKEIIDTIDGEKLSDSALEQCITKLPAADMLKIQNMSAALDNCFGLNNTITVDCPRCGKEIPAFFRFGPEFFRPTTI